MLLICGVGEDCWGDSQSLGLQGDPTSQSQRKSVLNIHWKDWCWSWSSNIWGTWCEELTHWKRLWCWKYWRQEEKGLTEDEMVGWHHRLNGHEFWVSSGSQWWTGKPGVLLFMGSQTVVHDWVTELNWRTLTFSKFILHSKTYISYIYNWGSWTCYSLIF